MNKYEFDEPTGFTCGKCGNNPGIIYDADVGDYFCSECYEMLQELIEAGYSVTDWMNEI